MAALDPANDPTIWQGRPVKDWYKYSTIVTIKATILALNNAYVAGVKAKAQLFRDLQQAYGNTTILRGLIENRLIPQHNQAKLPPLQPTGKSHGATKTKNPTTSNSKKTRIIVSDSSDSEKKKRKKTSPKAVPPKKNDFGYTSSHPKVTTPTPTKPPGTSKSRTTSPSSSPSLPSPLPKSPGPLPKPPRTPPPGDAGKGKKPATPASRGATTLVGSSPAKDKETTPADKKDPDAVADELLEELEARFDGEQAPDIPDLPLEPCHRDVPPPIAACNHYRLSPDGRRYPYRGRGPIWSVRDATPIPLQREETAKESSQSKSPRI